MGRNGRSRLGIDPIGTGATNLKVIDDDRTGCRADDALDIFSCCRRFRGDRRNTYLSRRRYGRACAVDHGFERQDRASHRQNGYQYGRKQSGQRMHEAKHRL